MKIKVALAAVLSISLLGFFGCPEFIDFLTIDPTGTYVGTWSTSTSDLECGMTMDLSYLPDAEEGEANVTGTVDFSGACLDELVQVWLTGLELPPILHDAFSDSFSTVLNEANLSIPVQGTIIPVAGILELDSLRTATVEEGEGEGEGAVAKQDQEGEGEGEGEETSFGECDELICFEFIFVGTAFDTDHDGMMDKYTGDGGESLSGLRGGIVLGSELGELLDIPLIPLPDNMAFSVSLAEESK
jgi:hypothetical protein